MAPLVKGRVDRPALTERLRKRRRPTEKAEKLFADVCTEMVVSWYASTPRVRLDRNSE